MFGYYIDPALRSLKRNPILTERSAPHCAPRRCRR
jgi:hypothetical protein